MKRFKFPHSHAFSGGQLTVEVDGGNDPVCTIEFADGVVIVGEVIASGGEHFELAIPAYETSKGNVVSARRWRITKRKDESVWRSIPALQNEDDDSPSR